VTIDRNLPKRMASERASESIVSALIGLDRGFGLTIAAEGIAGSGEASALLPHGCHLGQGDLYGEPPPASLAMAWLTADEGQKRSAFRAWHEADAARRAVNSVSRLSSATSCAFTGVKSLTDG
jgi:FOG: EAL domain